MAALLLEVLVSAAITVLIKACVWFARHWIAWELAAGIAVVVVVVGLIAIDAPNMHRWWR
jgi:hypothetical protein